MVVDSSVWLEIFLEGKLKDICRKTITSSKPKIPSLCLFEIYKKIKTQFSEGEALEAIGSLSQFIELPLTREVSLLAADLSLEFHLAMADSIVLAHARQQGEKLVTLDNDFANIPGVKVLR